MGFRAFIEPSDQNQLYHTSLLSKIWVLTEKKKLWMIPLSSTEFHHFFRRVQFEFPRSSPCLSSSANEGISVSQKAIKMILVSRVSSFDIYMWPFNIWEKSDKRFLWNLRGHFHFLFPVLSTFPLINCAHLNSDRCKKKSTNICLKTRVVMNYVSKKFKEKSKIFYWKI